MHRSNVAGVPAAFLVVGIAAFMACERQGDDVPEKPMAKTERGADPSPTTQSEPDGASPLQTVRRMHELRMNGRYREMLALVAPEHRSDLLELVLSVDELIAAEKGLQSAIAQYVGEGSATHFARRDQVANMLGPLSRDIEIMAETISDDSAEVAIQVASRIPLEKVKLRRQDGSWQVLSDAPIVGLAKELGNLAATTRRVTENLKDRQLTAEQVYDELLLRQAPVLERIAVLVKGAEDDSPAGNGKS